MLGGWSARRRCRWSRAARAVWLVARPRQGRRRERTTNRRHWCSR